MARTVSINTYSIALFLLTAIPRLLVGAVPLVLGLDDTAKDNGFNIYIGHAKWDDASSLLDDDTRVAALVQDAFNTMRAQQVRDRPNGDPNQPYPGQAPDAITLFMVDNEVFLASSVKNRETGKDARDLVRLMQETQLIDDNNQLKPTESLIGMVLRQCMAENPGKRDHVGRCGEMYALQLYLQSRISDQELEDKQTRLVTMWDSGGPDGAKLIPPCSEETGRLRCSHLMAWLNFVRKIDKNTAIATTYQRPDSADKSELFCGGIP